jgi:hypothetical protein
VTFYKLILPAGGMAFAMALTVAPVPAHAQSETIRGITNMLGLTSEEKAEIEYRERAPLVLPKDYKLSAPEAPVEQRVANWPRDPDVVAKRQAAAEARRPRGVNDGVYGDTRQGAPLSGHEMRSYGRLATGEGRPTEPYSMPGDSSREVWIRPDVLTSMRNSDADADKLQPGVEPTRKSLTDPPVGARLPSSNAPFVYTRSNQNTLDRNEPNAREYATGRMKDTE